MSTNTRSRTQLGVMGTVLSAFGNFSLPEFNLRSAQQAHDDALHHQCTRCKYTPASVHKAFKRRRNLLAKNYGHHVYKMRPEFVNIINNIK